MTRTKTSAAFLVLVLREVRHRGVTEVNNLRSARLLARHEDRLLLRGWSDARHLAGLIQRDLLAFVGSHDYLRFLAENPPRLFFIFA